jgi:hypothetical protein
MESPAGSRPAQRRRISRLSLADPGQRCLKTVTALGAIGFKCTSHGVPALRTAVSQEGPPMRLRTYRDEALQAALKQKRSDRHGYLSVSRRLDVEVHLLLRSRITHGDRQQPTARCGSSFPVSRICAYRIVQPVYRALPCVVPNRQLLRFGVCVFHQSRNRTRILDRVIDQRIAVVIRNDLDDESPRTGGITRGFCPSTIVQ